MNTLDILSLSPTYYIFQQKTNKTHFGGVLVLIYLIIMFFISLSYILDYVLNDKFEIASSIVYTIKKYDKNKHMFIYDHHLDQTVNIVFALDFYYDNESQFFETVNNTFLVLNDTYYKGYSFDNCRWEKECFLIFNITIPIVGYKKDKNSLNLIFKCNDDKCSNYKNDTLRLSNMATRNLEIKHNEPNPIITEDCFQSGLIDYCDSIYHNELYDNSTLEFNLKIFNIIYEEKQGISRIFNKIFNISTYFSFYYFEQSESNINYKSFKEGNNIKFDHDFGYHRHFAEIQISPSLKYQWYQRRKINFLDVMAKIGALFSTFYSILSIVIKFYSKNFDNYKIIEKLLQNNKVNKNKIIFNKNKINTKIELNKINLENENSLSSLIDSNSEEEINEKELNTTEKETIKDNIIKKNKILPKFSFFDFYFNNIYCKCFKRIEKQDLLDNCNKIISKYVSIDNIVYNMIKLENLFKDYEWKEPEINNFENNEFISEIIKSLNTNFN
jgi:hypothetical protein